MSHIKIDMKKIRSANSTLPSIGMTVGEVKRGMGMMRWRIPEEIQNENQIKQRIVDVINEIGKLEEQINEVYKVTNNCVSQYLNAEEKNSVNADKFE